MPQTSGPLQFSFSPYEYHIHPEYNKLTRQSVEEEVQIQTFSGESEILHLKTI